MAYTRAWDETLPNGSEAAATLDDILRNFKIDLRERLDSIIGVAIGTALADPVVASGSSLAGITSTITGLSAVYAPISHTHNASDINAGTLASARIAGSYTGITGVGTLAAGSIPATLITAGTFGTGNYTFNGVVLARTVGQTKTVPVYGNLTPDLSLGGVFYMTVDGTIANITIGIPTNPTSGQNVTFIFKNTSVTLNQGIIWNGVFKNDATAATVPLGKRLAITYFYDGTDYTCISAIVSS